jgi:hypothetical protein
MQYRRDHGRRTVMNGYLYNANPAFARKRTDPRQEGVTVAARVVVPMDHRETYEGHDRRRRPQQTLLLYRPTLRRGPMHGLAVEQPEAPLAALSDSSSPGSLSNV